VLLRRGDPAGGPIPLPVRWSPAALLSLCSLMAAGCTGDAADPAVGAGEPVAYADGVTFEVRVPDQVVGAPVVVLLHGCCGDTADMADLAYELAGRGVLVFNATWTTLERGGGWPRSYADVHCAIGVARTWARSVGAEAERLTTVAWSDGALLAAVVALAPPSTAPGCRAAGARPDAVVALGGYFGGGPDGPRAPPGTDGARLESWFGGPVEEVPSAWRAGNPRALIADGRVAATEVTFDLVVGRDDALATEARRFDAAVRRAGLAVELHEVAGGHFDVITPRTAGGARAVEIILERSGAS
jgi:hypothetical protein